MAGTQEPRHEYMAVGRGVVTGGRAPALRAHAQHT